MLNLMWLVLHCAGLSMCFCRFAGAELDFLLLAPPAPNSMLNKLTLVLRFLDSLRGSAGASGAELDVFGPALC